MPQDEIFCIALVFNVRRQSVIDCNVTTHISTIDNHGTGSYPT
jgi:hypothetical protein